MSSPYSRAPHVGGASGVQPEALNAALLIDFDNVTMGMRSDLSKELKTLLNSDIIKGKVTVQRAYADWRRYPQYIVPLSENSVDLIFAPAYGSSKKNATDIRMAIDGMELVFIRPEIGTFILLTGDSDFSSLVLKLKEYGKYVIGVGIQESSSDILVQNCDEYYSYTSLTGLRKTTDSDDKPVDPWILVEQAVARMASRDDVMRSDRLKQVMIEIDASFDEGNFGFSKFSRFLSDAGSRGLISLRKLENGQFEVLPATGGSRNASPSKKEEARKAPSRGRGKGKDKEERSAPSKTRDRSKQEARPGTDAPSPPKGEPDKAQAAKGARGSSGKDAPPQGGPDETQKAGGDPLKAAYKILQDALSSLVSGSGGGKSVRDSDLKRKMLRLEPSFDEGDLGFGKFSRFLRQAHDHEIIDLEKREEGTYQVSQRGETPEKPVEEPKGAEEPKGTEEPKVEEAVEAFSKPQPEESTTVPQVEESQGPQRVVGLRRGGGRGRKSPDGPPPLFEGQVVGTVGGGATQVEPTLPKEEAVVEESAASRARTPRGRRGKPRGESQAPQSSAPQSSAPQSSDTPKTPGSLDFVGLGLPTDGPALVQYLTNSYKGVGRKTAERLVSEFGSNLFEVLHREPKRLGSVLSANRVEQLLEGWKDDLGERLARTAGGNRGPGEDQRGEQAQGRGGAGGQEAEAARESSRPQRRTRKGTRSRKPRGTSGKAPEDPA